MDAPTTAQLLTVGGNAAITYLVVEMFWRAWNPTPETKDRFGPLVAALTGIGLAVIAWLATTAGGAPYASLVDAVLIGLVGGLSSIGVHDVADSATSKSNGLRGSI